MPTNLSAPHRRDFLTSLACSLGWVGASALAAEDALHMMQQVYDRPSGRDVTAISRMELIDKGGTKRIRDLVSYRLERAKGDTSSLVRFLSPADIAGTGLLSNDKPDGGNEQWLYLPGLERVRRIASERKGGRFVGSDLYFEDLQGRRPSQDSHRALGREAVEGVACEVIESVPVEAGNSVYRRRLAWVDPQTLIVLRVDYFERDDSAPTKRWQAMARQRVQGYWTVTDSRTTDLGTGHETRLTSSLVKYDRKLPAKLFTSQALSDETLESTYRP